MNYADFREEALNFCRANGIEPALLTDNDEYIKTDKDMLHYHMYKYVLCHQLDPTKKASVECADLEREFYHEISLELELEGTSGLLNHISAMIMGYLRKTGYKLDDDTPYIPRFELLEYLCFLASSDGVVTQEECEIISKMSLDMFSFSTPNEISDYVSKHKTLNALPPTLLVAIKADNYDWKNRINDEMWQKEGRIPSMARGLLHIYKEIGQKIIIADEFDDHANTSVKVDYAKEYIAGLTEAVKKLDEIYINDEKSNNTKNEPQNKSGVFERMRDFFKKGVSAPKKH